MSFHYTLSLQDCIIRTGVIPTREQETQDPSTRAALWTKGVTEIHESQDNGNFSENGANQMDKYLGIGLS